MIRPIKYLFKQSKRHQGGYLLLELPIVMAIIAGVATISLVNAKGVLIEARGVRRAADAYQVTLALALYYDDHLSYPLYLGSDTETSLQILGQALVPDYMQELPIDPRSEEGQTYRYRGDEHKATFYYFSEEEGEGKERSIY